MKSDRIGKCEMKKLLFLAACILLVASIAGFTFASSPLLSVEFSTTASDTLKKGDMVEYTVMCRDITSPGLSSFDLVFDYSEGLSYNGDMESSPLPEGWVMWEPVDENGKIRVGVIDESVVSAGFDDIKLTFSFTVESDSFTEESVTVTQRDFYDFDLNLSEYTFIDSTASFLVNMPDITFENIGASLRLTGKTALRFGAKLHGDSRGVVLGMLVCPSDKLDGELTHTVEDASVYTFTKPLFDNTYSTPAVETDADTEYTFRPFVKLTTKNTGRDVHVMFEEEKRSAKSVALLALENETDSKKIALLESVISGT